MANSAIFTSLINVALGYDRANTRINLDSQAIEQELQEPRDLDKAKLFRYKNSITN